MTQMHSPKKGRKMSFDRSSVYKPNNNETIWNIVLSIIAIDAAGQRGSLQGSEAARQFARNECIDKNLRVKKI